MSAPRPRWQRRIARPIRRAPALARSVRDGALHGWGRPSRWPRDRPWPFGPTHPHDGREVTVFVAGRSHTLVPATLDGRIGRTRGHRFDGTLRPTADELAAILIDVGVPPAAASHDGRTLAAISSIEGGFDALQTYDRARFSWGFVQFAATGGLPSLLRLIASDAPDEYERYFASAGIGLSPGTIVVTVPRRAGPGDVTSAGDNRELQRWHAINRLHDDISLWRPFLLAAHDPQVQRMQVVAAHRFYVTRAQACVVPVGAERVTLADLVGDDPLGQATIVDHAIHRGMTYTARLFEHAAREAGATGSVVAVARSLEPADEGRWAILEAALAVSADDIEAPTDPPPTPPA